MVCLEEVFLVTCAFLKKKVHSLSVAPEPLTIWNKKLKGLESYVEVVCLEEVFLVTCAFSKKKVHSLSVAPSLLLFGTKSWRVLNLMFFLKNSDIARSGFFWSGVLEVALSLRSLLGDVRFFEGKSALTECSPRASYYLEQRVGGSRF